MHTSGFFDILEVMITPTTFSIKESDGYRFVHLKATPVPDQYSPNPVLVLIHGMFGDVGNFQALAQKLQAAGCDIWIPELPLEEAPRNVSIQYLGNWLRQFLRQMQINDPVLVGNSLGGHIALDVVIRKTYTVAGLILTGSSGLFENHFGDSTPRRYDRSYVRNRMEQTFEHFEITERMVDRVMNVLGDRSKLLRIVSLARSTRKYNVESQLKDISLPTLLVWGKQDQITPPHVAEQFATLLPDATLRWIDRCGHAPMMEYPDRFFVEMKPFIERIFRTKEVPLTNSN
ncbi:MAG: alpha/beta fold hydrolase [Bacteroidota bacterium]